MEAVAGEDTSMLDEIAGVIDHAAVALLVPRNIGA